MSVSANSAMRAAFALDDAPLPGRDFDPTKDDLKALRPIDGVVLGGYLDDRDMLSLAAFGPDSGALFDQIRYVHRELLRRVREKIDAATGEVVWFKRPSLAEEDGALLRQDPYGRDRWAFYMRTYFRAPGVEPTLVQTAPIVFVRQAGT